MKSFDVYVNVDRDKYILEVTDSRGNIEDSISMSVDDARILYEKLGAALGFDKEISND